MRWWEHYVVRYMVGTVAGAAIIAFLAKEKIYTGTLEPLLQFKEAEFLGVSLLLVAGFAYCYIASAPVLALHALRAHLRVEVVKKHPVRHGAVAAGAVLLLMAARHVLGQVPGPVYWAVGVLLSLQLSLLILAASTGFTVVESFSRSLAARRSDASRANQSDTQLSPASEYVTSYRHLREHGNAVLIVFLEGVLAIALLSAPSQLAAVYVIGVWLIPATFTWFLGTVLESRFVATPV